jgi:hypothetical protein
MKKISLVLLAAGFVLEYQCLAQQAPWTRSLQ